MLHTIISGIEKLSDDSEKVLSKFSSIAYLKINEESELHNALNSCDVFWFRLNHNLSKTVLKNVKCKYILCAATGLDHIDLNACKENNIAVISLKGESDFLKEVRATAEHTLGLLLALIRKTKLAFNHVEQGEWDRYKFQGFELYKKNVGIYGMGRLGKIMADYYYTMGMTVFYFDTNKDYEDIRFTRVASPEELCSHIDVLSIHLPYNDATHFIIHKDILKHLPANAFIVNTARGGVVNENDLLEMLEKKQIYGYATDVLYNEPQIKEHKLVKYAQKNENIIITPHIGGNTYESIEKTEFFIVNKLYQKIKG